MLMDLEYVDITKKSRDGGFTAEEIARNEGSGLQRTYVCLARRFYKESRLYCMLNLSFFSQLTGIGAHPQFCFLLKSLLISNTKKRAPSYIHLSILNSFAYAKDCSDVSQAEIPDPLSPRVTITS